MALDTAPFHSQIPYWPTTDLVSMDADDTASGKGCDLMNGRSNDECLANDTIFKIGGNCADSADIMFKSICGSVSGNWIYK